MSEDKSKKPGVVFQPQPGQMLPFLLPLRVKEVLLEGTRGGGKSLCLLASFLRGVGKGWGPDWKGVLFKRTHPETLPLMTEAIKFYQANCTNIKVVQHPYGKFVWPGGEHLTIRHMMDESDYDDLHGSQFTWIGWEELTNWAEPTAYLKCMSLLRSAHPEAAKWMQVWSTTNPGQVGHCIPFGDVLTYNRGWVDIKEITTEDTVVTVDALGAARPGSISDVVKVHFEGEMITRKGRGTYLEFTSNHRLPHLSTDRTRFELKPYTELPGQAFIKACADSWQAPELESFTVPAINSTRKIRFKQPDTISGQDYAELMGWFLSEGSCIGRDKGFAIAQSKEHNREKIIDLLTRCGFRFSTGRHQFCVYSEKWYEYFKQFGKCRDKYVPRELLNAGPDTLRALFTALMAGDGHDETWYYTTSKQLCDDVCEIGVKLGYRVYAKSRQRKNRVGLTYDISFTYSKPIELVTGHHIYDVGTVNTKYNVDKSQFSGTVYCLTVPETETFFVRQNGCVWLSGNTWVMDRWQLPRMRNKIIEESEADDDIMKRWSNDALVKVKPRPRASIFLDVRNNHKMLEHTPEYLADMARQATSDMQRRAWLDGDWDILAGGLFYDCWNRQYHVLERFPIPKSWKIDRALDWGSSSPFCVLWFAESDGSDFVDAEGRWRSSIPGDIFVIHEWYGTTNDDKNVGLKLPVSEVAKGIIERELEWNIYNRVIPGPADNQIHQELQAGQNLASDFSKPVRLDDGREFPGVEWTRSDKADGARKTGCDMIRERLSRGLPNPKSPTLRELPSLYFIADLKYTVKKFPLTPRDEKDPDTYPKKGDYHIQDVLRYRILADGRPVTQGSVVGKY